MSSTEPARPGARVAEARRNRARLIAAASQAFALADAPVSLEAIARDAGVGIGTLYRHFPQRESLVEAVYADQIHKLTTSAETLLAEHPPAIAFREWASVFVDWAVTKHGMIDALGALLTSGRLEQGQMRRQLVEMVEMFLDAGATTGDLRRDVAADDVAALLAGALAVAGAPHQRDQIARMIGLILDSLQPPVTSRASIPAVATPSRRHRDRSPQ